MSSFVDVPAADIENLLTTLRFERSKQRDEVVYFKRSSVDRNLIIKVYTSIRDGSTKARDVGRDSIKVCVVYDDGAGRSFGVGRFPPVFRVTSVQSVLERLRLKIQEAAVRARDWLSQQGKTVPATPPPPPPSAMEMEDLRMKSRFAEQERLQEQAAFLSDPDLSPRVQRNIAAGLCPDGCCGPSPVPIPTPAPPRELTFREQAAKLNVPFD